MLQEPIVYLTYAQLEEINEVRQMLQLVENQTYHIAALTKEDCVFQGWLAGLQMRLGAAVAYANQQVEKSRQEGA